MATKPSDFFGLADLEMSVNAERMQEVLDLRAKHPRTVCAIDPDRNGAIVVTDAGGKILFRTGHFASGWEEARRAVIRHDVEVFLVEQAYAGRFPGAGLSGARLVGAVLGVLLIGRRGATVLYVAPSTWQNALLVLPSKAKREERKAASVTHFKSVFGAAEYDALPRLVREGVADAYGIASWWRRLPDFYV